jgi:hypothetical protein
MTPANTMSGALAARVAVVPSAAPSVVALIYQYG